MRFLQVLAASTFLSGSALASDCPPLFSHPAVEEVIAEHIRRVELNRTKGLRSGYNKDANEGVLRGRIRDALQKHYVLNPEFRGPTQSKREEANNAVWAVSFGRLAVCFPAYLAMYNKVVGEEAETEPTASQQALAPKFERDNIVDHPAARAAWANTRRKLEEDERRNALTPEQRANEDVEKRETEDRANQGAADERAAARKAWQEQQDQPLYILETSYHSYMMVSACHEARAGLAYQYITDRELADTKVKMLNIENAVYEKEPTVDIDQVWKETAANFGAERYFVYFNPHVIKMLTAPSDIVLATQLKVMRDQHMMFYGTGTGEARLDAVKNLARNSGELGEQLKAKCQDAYQTIKSALVRLRPSASLPKKDF